MRIPKIALAWGAIGVLTTNSAHAACNATIKQQQLLDRISLTLRGVFPTTEEKAALCQNGKAISEIADDFRHHPGFTKKLGEFWTKILGIQSVVDFASIKDTGETQQTLGEVFPQNAPDKLREKVAHSFTMEPGWLLAMIVRDDRPWDDAVRTKDGPVNGPLASYITNHGELFLKVSPPDSYPQREEDEVFQNPDLENMTPQWVSRGNGHAGILTTPAFHLVTNGRRAKFNRAYTSLLCREFVIPPGVKQVPSNETELTRKPGCQSCHSVVEPGATLFGRWPGLGTANYFYDNSASAFANAQIWGQKASDTTGMGQILSNKKDFNECAVKRAFQFIVGRDMEEGERSTMLPILTQEFLANDKKVWPIMLKIINSKSMEGLAND